MLDISNFTKVTQNGRTSFIGFASVTDKLHLIVLSKNAINQDLTDDETDLVEIQKIEQENVWFSNEEVTSILGFDLFD